MSDLRYMLGNYVPRNGSLPKHGLTLHDLGELLRRAGLAAGFIVESEFRVRINNRSRDSKIDWVWLSPEQPWKPILAVEIEGRDVAPKSVKEDVEKFKKCEPIIKVIALFQVDHDRNSKKVIKKPDPCKRVIQIAETYCSMQNVECSDLQVVLDEELFQPEGIEKLQVAARNAIAREAV